MLKAGVIGWPVKHSLSPKLHTHWLKELGIEGEYTAMAVEAKDLAKTLKFLRKNGISGVNVTIPHKKAVIEMLDSIDEVARGIDAVNTIVVGKDGKLRGSNTDIYGFTENIKPHLSNKNKAVVLGAGGAAKSVCKSLLDLGFNEMIILNRTYDKAMAISQRFDNKFIVADWEDRDGVLEGTDLLVNTTSLGLEGKEALDIDLSTLPKEAIVTDVVYAPLITPLLAAAQARGNKTVDGLGMLIYQAIPGFEAWFGKRPNVTPASLEQLKQMLLA